MYYIIEGPATIWYGQGHCDAQTYAALGSNDVCLGITEQGVSISTQLLTHRVSSDDFGGTEGPPAEIINLGATASVQGTLVKWNNAAFDTFLSGISGGTPGVLPFPARGIFSDSLYFAVWVVGSTAAYYFPKCDLASQPKEWNVSSLERRMNLNITALTVNPWSGTPHVFYKETDKTTETHIGQLIPVCAPTTTNTGT